MRVGYDKDALELILCHQDGPPPEEGVTRMLDAIVQLDRDARGKVLIPATVLVIEKAQKPIDARQRERIAEMWARVESPMHLLAIVSTSPIVRGVATVVTWLNPPGSRRKETIHPEFESAVRWIGAERGRPPLALEQLWASMRPAPLRRSG